MQSTRAMPSNARNFASKYPNDALRMLHSIEVHTDRQTAIETLKIIGTSAPVDMILDLMNRATIIASATNNPDSVLKFAEAAHTLVNQYLLIKSYRGDIEEMHEAKREQRAHALEDLNAATKYMAKIAKSGRGEEVDIFAQAVMHSEIAPRLLVALSRELGGPAVFQYGIQAVISKTYRKMREKLTEIEKTIVTQTIINVGKNTHSEDASNSALAILDYFNTYKLSQKASGEQREGISKNRLAIVAGYLTEISASSNDPDLIILLGDVVVKAKMGPTINETMLKTARNVAVGLNDPQIIANYSAVLEGILIKTGAAVVVTQRLGEIVGVQSKETVVAYTYLFANHLRFNQATIAALSPADAVNFFEEMKASPFGNQLRA